MPQVIHAHPAASSGKSPKSWLSIAVVSVFTVVFLYMGITRLQRQSELNAHGQIVDGTVVAVYETTNKNVKSWVDFTYQVGNTVYHATDRVNGSFYHARHRGEIIPITYSTLHPALARTEGSMETWDGKWLFGLGCFSLGLGIVLLFIPSRQQTTDTK